MGALPVGAASLDPYYDLPPPTRPELGAATWNFMHAVATNFPAAGNSTAEQRQAAIQARSPKHARAQAAALPVLPGNCPWVRQSWRLDLCVAGMWRCSSCTLSASFSRARSAQSTFARRSSRCRESKPTHSPWPRVHSRPACPFPPRCAVGVLVVYRRWSRRLLSCLLSHTCSPRPDAHVESGDDFGQYMCELHNVVNGRLDKCAPKHCRPTIPAGGATDEGAVECGAFPARRGILTASLLHAQFWQAAVQLRESERALGAGILT